MTSKLPVNVFWGEHRTSELLSLAVKDKLENNSEIQAANINFVEFTEYQWNDYIEQLYRLQEILQKGGTKDQFDEIIRTEKNPQLKKYEQKLHEEYGPVSFNLHDSKGHEDKDIQFWIPETIQEDRELSGRLIRTGYLHGLTVKNRIYKKDPQKKFIVESPLSIIVELNMQTLEGTMQYPSKEVERLAKEFSGRQHKSVQYKEQVAKTDHPIFIKTVEKYSNFMKDVIIATNNVDLTLYKGETPRIK